MDAVKFLQERQRMYESGAATPSIGLEDDYNPVSAVEVVEKWAAAHPHKTRQSVFLEQWPNARPADDGVLTFCPKRFDFNISCLAECHSLNSLKKCSDCRREFWLQEVE